MFKSKRSLLLVVAMVLSGFAIFLMPTYAGKPIPQSDNITVMSGYSTLFDLGGPEPQEADFVLLTVPEGKTFILTDVRIERDVDCSDVVLSLLENSVLKYFPQPIISLQLISGIPFASGSTVHISVKYEPCPTCCAEPTYWANGTIFWSGYLMNS